MTDCDNCAALRNASRLLAESALGRRVAEGRG